MEILIAILAAIASGALAAAVIYVVLLTFVAIIDWFTSRQSVLQTDQERIVFTIRRKIIIGELQDCPRHFR